MIGLVAALPAEVYCFAGRLPPGGTAPLGECGWLQLSGMGRANARRAAVALADAGATALMSWGCAGGLDPTLKAGALLLPAKIRAADARVFLVSVAWHKQLRDQLSWQLEAHVGDLLEASHPLTSAAKKNTLFCATGAAAVDMESAAVAEVAAERGLEFAALRVVLDPAARALPGSALAAIDTAGRLQVSKLLRSLLQRPRDLYELLQLRSDLRMAQTTLATAARLTALGAPVDKAADKTANKATAR